MRACYGKGLFSLVSWLAPSLSGNIRLVLAKELNANLVVLKNKSK
jgi:hypothetical protein